MSCFSRKGKLISFCINSNRCVIDGIEKQKKRSAVSNACRIQRSLENRELTEKSSAPMEQLCVRRSALYGSICVPQI